MTVLLLMIPISLGLSLFFIGAFYWATRSGQWDSIDLVSQKAILDEQIQIQPQSEEKNERKH